MKPENRNILILFVCLISLFLMLNLVSAINASSPNYSVGRFGTGLATSNASSENYQATSITEVEVQQEMQKVILLLLMSDFLAILHITEQ